jgi:outer membrane protein assembly complex protein YaeT
MRIFKRIAIAIGLLLLLVILAIGAIHLPSVQMAIWSKIQDTLQSDYNVKVEAERFSFRLYPQVHAEVTKVKVYGGPQNQNQFAVADRVDLFAPLSLLWSSDKIIEKVQLQNPQVDADYPPNIKERKVEEDSGTFDIKQIDIKGAKVRFAKYQIDELDLNSSLEGDSLIINNLVAKAYGSTLQASGRIHEIAELRYDLNFSLNGDASIVKAFVPDGPSITGPITASGKIGGAKTDIVIEGNLQSSALNLEKSSPFHTNAQYRINMADKVSPYQLQLQWSDFPVASLRKFTPELPVISSFSNGSLQYKGSDDPFAAEGKIQTQLRPAGSGALPVAGSIQVDLKNGTLLLQPSNLAFRSTFAKFSGTVQRDSLDMSVNARIGNASDLAVFSPDLRKIPGSYQVNATLQGPFKDLTVRGQVNGIGAGIKAQANGSFRTGPELVDATVSATFDEAALRRFDVQGLKGNFELDGKIVGSVQNPKIDGTLNAHNVNYEGVQIGSIDADLNSDGRTLYTKANIPDLASVVNGSYVWKTGNFQVDATTSDLNTEQVRPLLPAAAADVSGSVSATLHATGNAKRWRYADGQLSIESAKFKWHDFPVELESGSGARMESGVVTANLKSKIGSGSAVINGTYQLSNNTYSVNGDIESIKVDEIRPLAPQIPADVKGNVTATIQASGNAKNWKDSTAEIRFQEAFLAKSPIEIRVQENSTIVLRDRVMQADVNIALPDGQLAIQGTLPVEGTTGADLRVTGYADLNTVQPFIQQIVLSGKANVDLRVQGNLKDPKILGDFRAQNFIVQIPARQINFRGESVNAHFSGEDVQLNVAGLLNESKLKVEGTVPLTATRSGNLNINLDSFPLQSLAPQSEVTGTVSISVRAQGTGIKPELWQAQAEIKPQQVRIGETLLESTESLKIHLTQQQVRIEPFQLKAGDSLNLSIHGNADLQGQTLQADVKTEVDLIFLRNFVPDFTGSGRLVAEIKASGSIKDPQMSGLVSLDNGFARVPGYPIVIEAIQLRAVFDSNHVTIEKLNAHIGGGTVEGSGGFRLKNFQPTAADITLTGSNVGLRYPGDLRTQLNADLKLTSQEPNYLLSGNIDIVRSIYREDIDYRDRLVNSLLSQRRQLGTVANAPSRLQLDIGIKTLEDFRMDNNLARVRALANLEVKGDLSQPRILGRLQVRDGSILYFRANEFIVERGNIDFYGTRRLNPVFDFVLFAIIDNKTPPEPFQAVDQYEVEIRVSGTLDNLEDTTVSSYPRLEETQIYSLILTGGTNSTLSQAGSKLFQQELASYFAGQIFFGAPQKLADALGLTRVEIQPDLVSPEEDPSARLVIGQDITAQIGLIYSVSLSDTEDQTWMINYRLARNFSVRYVDQTDEANTLGLRHSLRFGPGSSALRTRKEASRKEREEIEKVILENEVALPDPAVFKKVDELEGMRYDYWRVQDEMLDLKSFLQDNGYLFPEVTVEENRPKEGKVDLKIHVSGRGKRNMEFNGYTPSGGKIKQYKQWWREGFSEQAVLEQIKDDLLDEIWKEHYLRAKVDVKTESSGDSVRHIFKIELGSLYPGAKLRFTGANNYGEQELLAGLEELYGSDTDMIVDAFHRFGSFKDRVEALYIQKGFMDVKASEGSTTFREDGLAEREIIIRENQPARIEDLEVSNGHGLPAELIAKLKAVQGTVYNPQALSEDLIRITEYYESNGYPNVDVTSELIKKPNNPRLLLRYDLNTGHQVRIGSIRITGNYSTRRWVIERRLKFKEGDLLVKSRLYESQRELYRAHIFQQVRIETEESESPDVYNVNVDVTESKKYRFAYGVRYDSESNVGGDFVLEDSRLFGTAQSVSYFMRANSIEQVAGLTYSIPAIGQPRGGAYPAGWDVLLSLRYEREDLNDLLRSYRAILSLQKQFSIWGPFIVLGEYGYTRVNTRETNPRPDNPFPFDVTDKISELSATILADTRDDPIDAKRGYFISLENSFAPEWLRGNVFFNRFYYQFFYFKSFRGIVWANGFRIGLGYPQDEHLIFDERFSAGGASTVRGFKLDQLGPRDFFGEPTFGDAVLILNQEVRFPVYKWFGGAAFYDGGNVYRNRSDLSFGDLRHSVGIGLRINTPFGVGRFDVGFNLDPQGDESSHVFHFGIGQAF